MQVNTLPFENCGREPPPPTSLLSTFVNEMSRARERETTRRKFTPMKEKQTEESVNNVGQKGNFVYVYIAVSTSHGPNINIFNFTRFNIYMLSALWQPLAVYCVSRN